MTAPQGKEVFTPLVTNAAKIAALETELRRLNREANELHITARAWGKQAVEQRRRAKQWRTIAIVAWLGTVCFATSLILVLWRHG